tara:strand:+ start:57 stop:365 length:309 start_codon:yes stop_codon:yes gene_type:complete
MPPFRFYARQKLQFDHDVDIAGSGMRADFWPLHLCGLMPLLTAKKIGRFVSRSAFPNERPEYPFAALRQFASVKTRLNHLVIKNQKLSAEVVAPCPIRSPGF